MIEPELALALSAREWSEDLRRFLADHGGARVRVVALEPEDLQGESFDVLVIDDICSFLTPRLVETVRRDGHAVIGVFDPAEFPDGGERLRALGAHAVLEATAHPAEFLDVIGRVAAATTSRRASGSAELGKERPAFGNGDRRHWMSVLGPGGGTGVTEIAIASSVALRARGVSVALVDGDHRMPSLAQRLGLALLPNVKSAIDAVEQRSGPISSTLQSRHGVGLLVGMPSASDWRQVRPRQPLDVIDELDRQFDRLVFDLGGIPGDRLGDHPMARAVVDRSDEILVVAEPTPVGITRLLSLLAEVRAGTASSRVGVLMNRAPRSPYLRGEVVDEIGRCHPTVMLGFIPHDAAVGRAAWNGALVHRGRFRSAVDGWIGRFDSTPGDS